MYCVLQVSKYSILTHSMHKKQSTTSLFLYETYVKNHSSYLRTQKSYITLEAPKQCTIIITCSTIPGKEYIKPRSLQQWHNIHNDLYLVCTLETHLYRKITQIMQVCKNLILNTMIYI